MPTFLDNTSDGGRGGGPRRVPDGRIGGSAAKRGVARLATRQAGRIHRRQLTELGVPNGTIAGWVDDEYLTRVLPAVYAVGHAAINREAALWAAVLYAGPGAMLSHRSAGHLRSIVDDPPPRIEVSTPRRVVSTETVRVYARRDLPRSVFNGLPITGPEQILLDLAGTADRLILDRALAQLDYRCALHRPAVEAICAAQRHRSVAQRAAAATLLDALEHYEPLLAFVNGALELEFLPRLLRRALPRPRLNVWVAGVSVDAHWPDYNLVVELDGGPNHSTRGKVRRDRRNELKLRAAGQVVLRYSWDQVTSEREEMFDELETWFAEHQPGG